MQRKDFFKLVGASAAVVPAGLMASSHGTGLQSDADFLSSLQLWAEERVGKVGTPGKAFLSVTMEPFVVYARRHIDQDTTRRMFEQLVDGLIYIESMRKLEGYPPDIERSPDMTIYWRDNLQINEYEPGAKFFRARLLISKAKADPAALEQWLDRRLQVVDRTWW
jgi:hypothetical protein